VWKDNRRRHVEKIPTFDVLHKYPHDYKAIFIGDASMSPYEISHPGGSVEHWNAESGEAWMARLLGHFPKVCWINPVREEHWGYTHSIQMLRRLMEGRMFPLTLDGLEGAMRALAR
jgi:uncharacterized protein with von Willebrand factor type A (vWA) domain